MNVRFKILLIFLLLFGFNNICYAFENDINGSTGWSTINLSMHSNPDSVSSVITTVIPGKAFLILNENGKYWKVEYDGKVGYIDSNYCLINMPDLIPSIVYNISNASSSIYRSSGYDLPDVTGNKLYSMGKIMNNKIGREEFLCPVLYSTAKMIDLAQQSALNDGYSLMIYDSYRPRSVSSFISQKLNVLYENNNVVRNNIDYSTGLSGTQYYWGQSWFLAQTLSSHNTGAAIDVTLYDLNINKEVVMPSAMHELSTNAIKYYSGSVEKTPSNYSVGMLNNIYAQKLENYLVDAGMTTLASEWWHFQDQIGYERIKNSTYSNGCDFQVNEILSISNNNDTPSKKYKITYNDGNNIFVSEHEYGDVVSLKSDVFKTGYRLIGWKYYNTFYNLSNSIIMPDNDIELIAEWELIIPKIDNFVINRNYINMSLDLNVNDINLGLDDIYNIKVYNHSDSLKVSGLIGTGDKVRIYLDNTLVSEYEVVIKGDVNGDGCLSVSDISRLYKYLKKKIIIDECYQLSANVNNDSNLSVSDVSKIYKVLKGKLNSL